MRIITGSAKGVRLKSAKGLSTRPTADRVKESLFSIIAAKIFDAAVLDLFAGTGALGLEALSRGAAHAVFVDTGTKSIISENAARTKLFARAEILSGDVFRELRRLGENGKKFDLVFCDPPYRKGLAEKSLRDIGCFDLLFADAIVIVEHGADETITPPDDYLAAVRRVDYGATTSISLFRKIS